MPANFHSNLSNAVANLQDSLDPIGTAHHAYSVTMDAKPKRRIWFGYIGTNLANASFAKHLSSGDIEAAIKRAWEMIPKLGPYHEPADGLASAVSGSGSRERSTAAGSVSQLEFLRNKIKNKIDWYNEQESLFDNPMTSDFGEQSLIANYAFPRPVQLLTAGDKAKLLFVTQYGLFQRYVNRHVEVVLEIHGRPADVLGLSGKQENYIYRTFGGGKHFDAAKALKLMGQSFIARHSGNYLLAVKAGWEMLGLQLKPITGPRDLIDCWGAGKIIGRCGHFGGSIGGY